MMRRYFEKRKNRSNNANKYLWTTKSKRTRTHTLIERNERRCRRVSCRLSFASLFFFSPLLRSLFLNGYSNGQMVSLYRATSFYVLRRRLLRFEQIIINVIFSMFKKSFLLFFKSIVSTIKKKEALFYRSEKMTKYIKRYR